MTDDLSTRLLKAINGASQEALDNAVSMWVMKTLGGRSRGWYEAECDCGWTTSGLQPVAEEASELHVEENHPPLITRLCQVHREIVEMYQKAKNSRSFSVMPDLDHASAMGRLTALGNVLKALAHGYGIEA